jgi:predicted unusual protein kinase regulating ubiquinone biosynthesis (AarF/ABC1/UbiB family)
MASGSQRSIARVTEIGRVATRHGFGYLVDRRRAADGEVDGDRGRRLREMLDELGPTFVKFGQLLSTRPDVVPPDIIVELQKLQDDVTPFPMDDVERVVREELGRHSSPSTSSRSRRRPSARCTGRRCRTTRTSSSRCSARRRPARSSPT